MSIPRNQFLDALTLAMSAAIDSEASSELELTLDDGRVLLIEVSIKKEDKKKPKQKAKKNGRAEQKRSAGD